jgi:YVTN family beta-propeller protein
MTSRLTAGLALTFLLLAASAMRGDSAPQTLRPGAMGGGVTLLPNGWKIAPAGRHIQVGDLPLAMIQSPDGRYLLISNNGYARPTVTVVDLEREYVTESVQLDHAWVGLAWHPDGRRFYVSGAGNTTVHEMRFEKGRVTRGVDFVLGRPMDRPDWMQNRYGNVPQSFIGGVAVHPDGNRLFAVHVLGKAVSMVDIATGRVLRTVDLPAEPYTCLVSADGQTLFVSLWGGARILLFDARTLERQGEIPVGEHPNAMALSKDGTRVFVACANTNAVWVVDVAARRATEQVRVSMFPDAPPGSTPNSVSVSPDGTRLLVANADNNTVAVVDISTPGHSEVQGFIPTGWYPTAVSFSRDGRSLFILSGKGLTSAANPRFRPRDLPGGDATYIGALLTGTVSLLPVPTAATLAALTKTAYSLTPYADAHRLAPADAPAGSPIPTRVGGVSPIKHVFYLIRENRTYDQVLGDIPKADGDPALTLFGADVTPNAHALASEFGVFDNFYVDAEVSYDGHAFSTGAYATDVVEKFWPTNYAHRGAAYLSEGGGEMRNAYGNLAAPQNGYIWDACVRAQKAVRSYGEFVYPNAEHQNVAQVPGLEGRIDVEYPSFNLDIPDQKRADEWLKDFSALEGRDQVPALSIIRLGNDHTAGTRPGSPTPRAMVADNDLALGRIVEAISKSRIWNESAIFVVEDDAQNGPDHVDAHRSVLLAISPFSRRRTVDDTLYTTSGVLRTIELILGLPPMSQYDAAATPMYAAFQATPVVTPFAHLDARVPLDEKNDWTSYGAAASARMDLSKPDLAPERELNEIVWRSIRGGSSAMPAVVRSAWVRRAPVGDGDDQHDR